nr:ribonuclease E/G [Roseospira visakhapatnamensis]
MGGRRPGAAVSRRLVDPAERTRLLDLVKDLVAPGESLVARTAAAGATPESLTADLARLRTAWAGLRARMDTARPPALLIPAPLDWDAVLSSRGPLPSVVILDDNAARDGVAEGLAEALGTDDPPPLALLVHAGADDLWEASGVAEAVDAALSPVVPLPGGGRLVVEPTSALVAVDVDAGAGPPGRANAAALAALPAEIRLRGLAGHIVVDLLPGGRGPRLAPTARQTLETALAADPAMPRLAGVSRLGLLELSRERRGPTLAEMMRGPAAQALAALRLAVREARATAATALAVTVSPQAAALLRGPLAPTVTEARTRLGLTLTVRPLSAGVDADPVIGPP